jgi:hypothetical protein
LVTAATACKRDVLPLKEITPVQKEPDGVPEGLDAVTWRGYASYVPCPSNRHKA